MDATYKLVRDGIKDIEVEKDPEAEKNYSRADGSTLSNYFREKILEESNEVFGAMTKEELTEELADVLEVVTCIARQEDIPWSHVEEKRIQKKKEKGGFLLGILRKKRDDEW
jgi:predicted house-cleaning noncanonical NTP pyrophosphatase (MazG superfamily)